MLSLPLDWEMPATAILARCDRVAGAFSVRNGGCGLPENDTPKPESGESGGHPHPFQRSHFRKHLIFKALSKAGKIMFFRTVHT